jgi:glycosyltransferase involved in cell wall biosynthesis
LKKKILILTPKLSLPGGVSNYYRIIQDYLPDNFRFMTRGRRYHVPIIDKGILILCYIFDFVRAVIVFPFYAHIVINTSLGKATLIRSAHFIKIAKLYNKEVTIFFRGLDPAVQNKINDGKYAFFFKFYFLADQIIVLSSVFKEKLIRWGYNGKIHTETTVIDEKLLCGKANKPDDRKINVLFLARVEKYKGVYELMGAIEILLNKNIKLNFILAGDGKELDELKAISKDKNLKISFPGYVKGESKKRLLSMADIFVFPSYAEGMPNSVLEALAFGIPVVVSNVGGIPDIFIDGKMGYLLESLSPKEIADKIESLVDNKELREEISFYNKASSSKFYAPNVAIRLEKIINHG